MPTPRFPSASQSVLPLRRAITSFLSGQAPIMYGLTVTGIPSTAVTSGIPAIGLVRPTWAHAGSARATKAAISTAVTGMATAAVSNTTTIGTVITIATVIAGAIMTTIVIMIAIKPRLHLLSP